MNAVCHIVGAGEFNERTFCPESTDYIIAADAGYEHIASRGFCADLVVGDFDSMKKIPQHDNIIKLPVQKDDTDMMTAVKKAIDMGFKRIMLHGAAGGRADHTIANLQTLSYIAEHGAENYLLGKNYAASAVKNASLRFERAFEGIISVFCMNGEAHGIYLRGLKYPLVDADMYSDMPLGVSNEFTGVDSEVEVNDGLLTVMWYDLEHGLPRFA